MTRPLSGARLLGLYRMRGKAERHVGELMDVLALAFSPLPAAKSHYRRRPRLKADRRPAQPEVRPQKETPLLLNLFAYDLLHAALRDGAGHRRWLESAR